LDMASAMGLKRKLKRNASKDHLPVEHKEVTCIRGGVCKQWQVVEITEKLGVDCVSISRKAPWLHNMLHGQLHNSKFHGAIANFVSDCAEKARQASDEAACEGGAAPSQGSEAHVCASAGPSVGRVAASPAKLGRKAVFDESSESEEEAGTPRKKTDPKLQKTSGEAKKRGGWVTVDVRGESFKCCLGPGRRMLIPLKDGLDRAVKHLARRAGEAPYSEQQDFFNLLAEGEEAVIAWRPDRQKNLGSGGLAGAWSIVYQDASGHAVRSQKGLAVRSSDDPRTQAQEAMRVLRKARLAWNEQDCTDRPRLTQRTQS